MKSVGIDLEQWARKGLFFHEAWRPTQFGTEMHLLRIHKLIDTLKPSCVIVDPVTNLVGASSDKEVQSMLLRLIDLLKNRGITGALVSLTSGGDNLEGTHVGISSLTDTWILLRDIELNGERNRCLYVLKSRGMAHSNQLREFTMTSKGIRLVPAYIGSGGVLTGSARLAQEAKEKSAERLREQETQRKRQEIDQKRLALQAQIAALQAEFASVEQEAEQVRNQEEQRLEELKLDRDGMARSRRAN